MQLSLQRSRTAAARPPHARRSASLAVLACLALGACAPRTEPPLLSELASFKGRVTIHCRVGGEERELGGELAFDRATGHIELTRRGAQTVSIKKLGDGPLTVFVDAVPRPPTEADEADFRLLAMAVHTEPGDAAQVTREPGRYAISLDDLELRVELEPEPVMPGHGR